MKNSEIFYFDVDGTLFDNEKQTIHESTIKSLKALKELGYKIALCTGRPLADIKEIIDIADWDGYVLSNGSTVYDKEFNLIHEVTFDPTFIKALIEACDGPLLLEAEQPFITREPNKNLLEGIKHFNIQYEYPIINYVDQPVYNIICYAMDSLDPDFHQYLKENVILLQDLLGNGEIIHPDSGKHKGVQVLNEFLGTTLYTGFGDGENDMEFLRNATHSVAMGNASDKVKNSAQYVTLPIDQDGIMHALIAHEVIKEGLL